MRGACLLLVIAALAAATLAAASPAGATNECRGLNPCVPVAGPWVVVPVGGTVSRPQVQYQLTCPRGFLVAGLDVELSNRAIDVAFLGSTGSPVSPGVTTSRSVVFVGSYVGRGARAPTFRPHAGCIPAVGGGRRTPTGLAAVYPPGQPTVRRVVTARVTSMKQLVAACRAGERLVAWYLARGFLTATPPSSALVAGLSARAEVRGDRVVALARSHDSRAVVQVGAVCAGGA
jgi:hypothetical protein